MIDIIKIWFEEEYIYGETSDGEVYRQSLLWYPRLKEASESERLKYEFGLDGIHWRNLDEDISFESFAYDDAEPTVIQRFFLTHPEISISGFSKRIGINVSYLSDYINGFAKLPSEWEDNILNKIHDLGIEMANIEKARI